MPLEKVVITEKDLKKIINHPTFWGKIVQKFRFYFGVVLSLAYLWIIVFVAINGQAFYARYQYSTIAQTSENVRSTKEAAIETKSEPTQLIWYEPSIIIGKLGISAPIISDVRTDQMTIGLQQGVAHFADTAYPGQLGNSVLVGHSSDFPWNPGEYKTIFSLLDKLEVGDEIIVTYGWHRFSYIVESQQIVKPSEVSVLTKTVEPYLTLITCYPVGTVQSRYIVRARLDSAPIGTQESEPIIQAVPRGR